MSLLVVPLTVKPLPRTLTILHFLPVAPTDEAIAVAERLAKQPTHDQTEQRQIQVATVMGLLVAVPLFGGDLLLVQRECHLTVIPLPLNHGVTRCQYRHKHQHRHQPLPLFQAFDQVPRWSLHHQVEAFPFRPWLASRILHVSTLPGQAMERGTCLSMSRQPFTTSSKLQSTRQTCAPRGLSTHLRHRTSLCRIVLAMVTLFSEPWYAVSRWTRTTLMRSRLLEMTYLPCSAVLRASPSSRLKSSMPTLSPSFHQCRLLRVLPRLPPREAASKLRTKSGNFFAPLTSTEDGATQSFQRAIMYQ